MITQSVGCDVLGTHDSDRRAAFMHKHFLQAIESSLSIDEAGEETARDLSYVFAGYQGLDVGRFKLAL